MSPRVGTGGPLDESELDSCLEVAKDLAFWAGERIVASLYQQPSAWTKKGPGDWATHVDLAIEDHVVEVLGERFPGHDVVGEERSRPKPSAKRPTWYVDPIDGTTNFVAGLPWCSFSLALADEQGAAVGVVAAPHQGETFYARRGLGAFLGKDKLPLRDFRPLEGGVVLAELESYMFGESLDRLAKFLKPHHCGTRIMGSSALALANLAAGRATAVLLGPLEPWDYLAGALLAKEAGAKLYGHRSFGHLVRLEGQLSAHALLAGAAPAADGIAEWLGLLQA